MKSADARTRYSVAEPSVAVRWPFTESEHLDQFVTDDGIANLEIGSALGDCGRERHLIGVRAAHLG